MNLLKYYLLGHLNEFNIPVLIYLILDTHMVDATANAATSPAASLAAPQVVSTSPVFVPHASEATQVFLRSGGAVAHLLFSPHPLSFYSGSHAAPLMAEHVVFSESPVTVVSH